MTGICEDKTLREFWTKCTDQTSLYIHPERMISMLEQKYNPVIAEKHLIDPVKGLFSVTVSYFRMHDNYTPSIKLESG